MTEEEKLNGMKLLNFMEHNGILQELNRTMLHPLGIEARLNTETQQIEFWETKNPEGYLLDRINPIQRQAFQRLSVRKNYDRQKKLGFGIQVQDAYRKETYSKITEPLIPPKRLKLEILLNYLNKFQHMMFERFVQNHKEKDDNFDPDQFDIRKLVTLLSSSHIGMYLPSINENDFINSFVNVANYAMLIVFNKELQIKADKYNEIMKEKNN